jgi:hypothetical protein
MHSYTVCLKICARHSRHTESFKALVGQVIVRPVILYALED